MPAGDLRERFEREAMPHLPSLYRAALYLTREEQAARDLAQEAMLRGFERFGQYEPGTDCRAWLLQILRRLFINRWRHERRRGGPLVALEDAPEPVSMDSPDAVFPPPEGDRLEDMLSGPVREAVMELPEAFREAVLLCDVEGYRYHEAAQILDCPVGTVMSRLYRGRRILRETLAAHAAATGIISPK